MVLEDPVPARALSRKRSRVVLNHAGHLQSTNIGATVATLLNSFF